jgi:hypothetical protein
MICTWVGDRVVLENVSLAFKAGKLSASGAERRRRDHLFNVLTAATARPWPRTVRGQDITDRSPGRAARVARSFQLMALFGGFSVFARMWRSRCRPRASGGVPAGPTPIGAGEQALDIPARSAS